MQLLIQVYFTPTMGHALTECNRGYTVDRTALVPPTTLQARLVESFCCTINLTGFAPGSQEGEAQSL